MPPIRILQIVTIMNVGGLESRLMDIYRAIDKEKIQFDFLTHRLERGAYDDEIEAMGGTIYRRSGISPKSLTIGKYAKQMHSFFVEHPQYQVAHCHLTELAGFPLQSAKNAGVPVRIAHSRSAGASGTISQRIFKRIVKGHVGKACTHAFAVSREAGEWVFGRNKFEVIPNAINARAFQFDEKSREITRKEFGASDSVVVGHVGRMSPVKNHDFLLDIFAEFHRITPKSKLLLLGNGILEQPLREKAERLDLSDVIIFAGVRKDVPSCMNAMDLLIMPSFFEGFPGAAIEAQAAGLPCILSDTITRGINVLPDLVSFFSLKESPQKWAEQIGTLLKISRRNTYTEIITAGFDIQTVAKYWEDFYCQNS